MMMGKMDGAQGSMMMGKIDEDQGKMAHPAMQEMKERKSFQQDDAQCQRMQSMEHRQEGMQERMSMIQMMCNR